MNTPSASAPYSSTSAFSRSLREVRGLAGGVPGECIGRWLARRAVLGAFFQRRLSELRLRPVRMIVSLLRISDEHAPRRAERLIHRLVRIFPLGGVGWPAAHRQLASGDVERDVTLELATVGLVSMRLLDHHVARVDPIVVAAEGLVLVANVLREGLAHSHAAKGDLDEIHGTSPYRCQGAG